MGIIESGANSSSFALTQLTRRLLRAVGVHLCGLKLELNVWLGHLSSIFSVRHLSLIILSLAFVQLVNAQPAHKVVAKAIADLEVCKDTPDPDPKRPVCGYNAISPVLGKAKPPKECAEPARLDKGRVKGIVDCISWLKTLENVKASEAGSGNDSMLDSKTAAPVPIVATSDANANVSPTPQSVASAPVQVTSEASVAVIPIQKTKSIEVASPASVDHMAQTPTPILVWILGVTSLVLGALVVFLYLKLNKVSLQYSERETKWVRDIKKRDEEIRQLASDRDRVLKEFEVSKRAAVAQKSVAPVGAASVALKTVAPAPVSETPAVPKAVAPQISRSSVQQAILKAIDVLANERVSLTEANFVGRIVGSVTNPDVKAALSRDLEPGLFFLCSGTRSAQGPELLAYRLKGADSYDVVPFPTAGRVGQFMRWYENAVGSYEVDPVLASKPAIGDINESGILTVRQKGLLA